MMFRPVAVLISVHSIQLPQWKQNWNACSGVGWYLFHHQHAWDLLCTPGKVWDHLVAKIRWEIGNSKLMRHGNGMPWKDATSPSLEIVKVLLVYDCVTKHDLILCWWWSCSKWEVGLDDLCRSHAAIASVVLSAWRSIISGLVIPPFGINCFPGSLLCLVSIATCEYKISVLSIAHRWGFFINTMLTFCSSSYFSICMPTACKIYIGSTAAVI